MKNTFLLFFLISSLLVTGCGKQQPIAISVPNTDGFEFGKMTIAPDGSRFEATVEIKNLMGKTIKISDVQANVMDANGVVIGKFEGSVTGEITNNETFIPEYLCSHYGDDIDLSKIKSAKIVVKLDNSNKGTSDNSASPNSPNSSSNWNGEIKTGYFSAKSSNDAFYYRLYYQDDAQNKGMVLSITDLLKGEETKLLLEYLSKSDGSGTRDFSCKATEATTLKENNITMTYLAANDAFKVTSGYGVDDLFKNIELRRE
ncbi:MAG TPA: hypothetical protein VHO03_08035 [Ignavibacteriales bacterium]|nr:hypothetical protein [Ignavibacteriales bacterium]